MKRTLLLIGLILVIGLVMGAGMVSASAPGSYYETLYGESCIGGQGMSWVCEPTYTLDLFIIKFVW